jgi:hypothetical protein
MARLRPHRKVVWIPAATVLALVVAAVVLKSTSLIVPVVGGRGQATPDDPGL